MALTDRGLGTFASGGASTLDVPHPGTPSAGDLLVLCVANKPSTGSAGPDTPAGWTLLSGAQATGGIGAVAANAGLVVSTIFVKIAVGNEGGTNVTLSLPTSAAHCARMIRWDAATLAFTLAAANGADATADTSWSITAGTALDVGQKDHVVACSAINGNSASFSAEVFAEDGLTVGTHTERNDAGVAATYNVRLLITTHTNITGKSTGNPPTYAMTASAASGSQPTGATVFLRIRETMKGSAPMALDPAATITGRAPVMYGAAGTQATGQTTLSIPYPAGLAAGHLLVLAIANKAPDTPPIQPTGWSLIPNAQAQGGAGSPGASSGPCLISVYTKIATGAESGNLDVSLPGANAAYGRMFRATRTTGDGFSLQAVNGADNTADTSWIAVMGGPLDVGAGDLVFAISAINGQVANFTAELITQTGVTQTFGDERADGGITIGNNVRLLVSTHAPQSGHGTDAPTYTATASGSTSVQPTGPTVLLRVRAGLGGALPIDVAPSPATLGGRGVLSGPVPIELAPVASLGGHGALTPAPLALALAPQPSDLIGRAHLSASPLALSLAMLASLGGHGSLIGLTPLSIAFSSILGGRGALVGALPVSVAVAASLAGVARLTGAVPLSLTLVGAISVHPIPGTLTTTVEPAAELRAVPSTLSTLTYAFEVSPVDVGDVASLIAEVKLAGVLTDPSTIACEVRTPSGVVTTTTYPHANLEKLATGRYRMTVPCAEAGRYTFRFVATGLAASAQRGSFVVTGGALS